MPYALSLVPGANVVQNADNSTAIYGKGAGSGSVGLYGESPLFSGVYGKGYNGVTGISSVPGAVATYGEHQGTAGYGVYGRAPDGYGTSGESTNSVGVYGKSVNFYGVHGESTDSIGVYGKSVESDGVYGESDTTVGVYGKGTAGEGVYGYSDNANGVVGESDKAAGVRGASHNAGHAGVVGYNDGGSYGVYGESTLSSGVVGVSNAQNSGGVYGEGKGNGGYGVYGEGKGNGGYGVLGKAANGSGVAGVSTNWAGVYGETATAGVPGVWAKNIAGGIAFKAEGNAVQSANKGGFVKAMVFVNSAGQIARCYNGVTGASSANCGFTASKDVPGGFSSFVIDFGFNVDNRFVSMTQLQPYGDNNFWKHWAYVKSLDGNKATVESGYRQVTDCQFCTADAASFMVFVY